MGMAASQARFLGLTARKNNVEYEGQQINQQRTALSNTSASYYTDLLGMAVPVCPAVEDYTQTIYSFNDGALTNSITSLIAKNDGTYNVSYLSSYTNDFAIVSGGSTSIVKDTQNGYMVGAQKLKGLGDDLNWAYVIREESQTYRLYQNGDNYSYTDVNGANKTLIPTTYDIITGVIGPEPQESDYNMGHLIENYENTGCFSSVKSSTGTTRAYHMEHNLCHLMWTDGRDSITSSDGVTVTRTAAAGNNYSFAGYGQSTTYDPNNHELQTALSKDFPDIYQQLVDLYIDTLLYMEDTNNNNLKTNFYTMTGRENAQPADINEMYPEWLNLWETIGDLDYSEAFYNDHNAWQEKYNVYDGNYVDATDHTQVYTVKERIMYYDGNDAYLKSLSHDQLENLYAEEVTYRDMLEEQYGKSENGWYVRYVQNTSTNEWEPIFYNGDDIEYGFQDNYLNIRTHVDTYKIGSQQVQNEIKGRTAYMEQDSTGRYINITFVEEDGSQRTYALSTNTVTDNDAYNDAMNQYEYDKALYDQSIAEINAKIEIIQAEDKNLELRLKQLDTEHDAISNELDAVSKVVEKNVESSFKTFG
ncbi:MAG: hypothetical protein NC390_01345 [Fusobacterium sp.]|nr:hypothetical protein [Fusobacterium sp.]